VALFVWREIAPCLSRKRNSPRSGVERPPWASVGAPARGIAKATSEDRYKGRAPPARTKPADIVRLASEGMKREDIASRLNIGVASVYRALAERWAAS
jgi:Helix-turn-helix domain of resolvase